MAIPGVPLANYVAECRLSCYSIIDHSTILSTPPSFILCTKFSYGFACKSLPNQAAYCPSNSNGRVVAQGVLWHLPLNECLKQARLQDSTNYPRCLNHSTNRRQRWYTLALEIRDGCTGNLWGCFHKEFYYCLASKLAWDFVEYLYACILYASIFTVLLSFVLIFPQPGLTWSFLKHAAEVP